MAKGNHSFTEQEIRKRFGAIIGHTVAEVDTAGVLTASAASRNKGRIGAVIEQSVLGYPADSDRRPDIVIDGRPWEVKATGLKEGARGGWCAKEPMSITAVAPEGIVTESFSTSAFWHKPERLLVVYYLYVRPGRGVKVEYAGFEFKGYDLHTWREVDRCRLEADWTTVREFVRTALKGDVDTEMPNLSTLINPQLLYLDTSPKWPNRPRFRLKASLVTLMARERLDDGLHMIPDQGGLSSMSELKAHLHGISDACAGQTLEELAAPFNLPIKTKSGRENKSLAEQVVVRLFTGHAGKISQVPLFAKAGIVFKTMTLTPTGGRTEDMKLNPSIDFDELCDPSVEFEDSSFAVPFIDSTMVVAVFEERYRNCPLYQCRFIGFNTLWLGTYLDAARALWDGMRGLIFSDGLVDAPVLKKDGTPRVTCLAHIADVDDVLDELTGGAMSRNRLSDPEELACLRYCATASLNLLLFVLSAENGAEIVYTPPKTPRGQKAGRRTNTETVRMLGAKIGSAIGAARRVRYAPHQGTGERTVAPHVRRAHWQSFWTGKRKGREDGKFGDELVVKWIPPIPVNQGAGEVTETVHLNSTEAGE